MQDYSQAEAFLAALNALHEPCNFRAIHDQRKDIPAIKRRGRLEEHWQELCQLNAQGYGIFVTIAAMDENGDKLANVAGIRAHYTDLDSLSAMQDLERTKQHFPPPSFAVQSSPNKAHVYWPITQRYRDNEWFTVHQAKLAQLFNGDTRITDPTRVMRLPGTYHCKGQPFLVHCFALPAYGFMSEPGALAASLAHVNVINVHSGTRKPLGDPDLAAPSLDWVHYAFSLADPNEMDRAQWIAFTSAIKQAMWNHAEPQEAFNLWSAWCAKYDANDPGENWKQWNDLEETQVGWRWVERAFPQIMAYRKLGAPQAPQPRPVQPLQVPAGDAVTSQYPVMPQGDNAPRQPKNAAMYGEILTAEEQAEWFKGCSYIANLNEIYSEDGRFYNSGSFTALFGGKLFIIDGNGKTTDEAWKAATRGREFMVPKLDHIRFLPNEPFGKVIVDDLGREGINVYKKPQRELATGDISRFLRHMELMLPVQSDRDILFAYLAHNIKFPGFKIPWAFFLQSAEGVGKGVIKSIMQTGVGRPYFYSPNAKELIDSGSKFNAWMRAKLFILVDEIKVDERRDMIEVLKPMISELEIEIQAKGQDQAIEDNFANWGFFSNYQNAIPITRNGRRFAPFFSAIQTADDLEAAGMNEAYFQNLYGWLRNDRGAEMVVSWLMQHPIQLGEIGMRAPETSSTELAIEKSRGPVERMIVECIEDGKPGFKAGWVSSVMIDKRLKERNLRPVSKIALDEMMNNIGYHFIGRSPREYFNEDSQKAYLYHKQQDANMWHYGEAQGFS